MRRVMTSAGLSMVILGALAGAAPAATLLNGGFEDGVLRGQTGLNHGQSYAGLISGSGSNWDRWSSLVGWTTTSGPGIEVQTRNTLGITPYDGDYYVELDSNANSTMAQEIELGAGSYSLSFAYRARSNNESSDALFFSIADLFGIVSTTTEGVIAGGWSVLSYAFSIDARETYALRFGAAGASDGLGGLLDGIALTRLDDTPVPVPVPAAGGLLAGALGLMALARRRRA